jgi:N-acetylglucosaminyl-diphospho-decaprenol L-rhamnosyltransferase
MPLLYWYMKKNKSINLKRKLSLVIITYNRSADLARTLKNLTELPEKVNIIVVDNASTDRTPIMVEALFPEVTLIQLDTNAMVIGRNVGAKAAKTPYIAFTDDDLWWKQYSLARAVDILDEYPKVGAIATKCFANKEQRPDPINRYFETSPLTSHVPMPGNSLVGFLEGAVIMRKKAFDSVGGYNEYLNFSQEGALLAIDLVTKGWGITYASDVIAYHYPSTLKDMHMRYRMGARNAILRAWLRRPITSALKETYMQLKLGMKDNDFAWGCLDAIKGLPYVLKNRKVVPAHVEEMLHLLALQDKALTKERRISEGRIQLARDM